MSTALAPSPLAAAVPVVVPTAPQPIHWESAISTLLADLGSVQQELLAVLAEKRARLGKVDVDGMEELQVREQALLVRLQTCHARREELLATAQREGLPSDSVTSLANGVGAKQPQREKLGKDLAAAAGRMRLLQTESLTNWVIAQRSLLHVSQLLEIIATGGRMQPTYGVGEHVHSRGGMIDHDA